MWYSVRALCRVCNHAFSCVCPVGTDLDSLQCPRCECMTAEATEQEEWEAVLAEQNRRQAEGI